MPSRADIEQFAEANRGIRRLVLRELARFWATLNHNDAGSVRDALQEYLPLLVEQYGDLAATVAADFYEDQRDMAGVAGAFVADLAEPPDPEAVRARARWAIGPIFSRAPDAPAALGRLEAVTDELSLQQGRETIALNTGRDPAGPRWARVPVGKTCAFCLMAASRGAVYRSEATAGATFHGHCDCTATPFWPKQPYPEGYDPDALYQQYANARQAAHSDATTAILAELRKGTDGH